jgi:hypothetical protein
MSAVVAVDKNPGGFSGSGPYRRALAISKSDTDELAEVCSAIYVGGAGDVTVILGDDASGGTPVLFKAMPLGLYRLRVKQLMSTGTAATNIVALY